ncbi:hypothetical protein ACFJIV_11320 [Mucilaginibacter sp. UC70_90]
MNTYIFHINAYDLAFLGAIFIGMAFALLLWFTKRINNAANRFFALALIVVVLYIARILAIDIQLTTYIPYWSRLPLQFSLGFGPLIFFYVLKITRPQYKFRFRDLLHFIPLLLELGTQLLEINDSIKTGKAAYDTLTFYRLNPAFQPLVFISVIIYLYASQKQIANFYRSIKFNGGDRYRYEMRWLHCSLIGFGILWLCWMFIAATNHFYYHNQLGKQVYYPRISF